MIDLSGATFVGSATIRVIARTCVSLQRRSRSLMVRSPSRCAQRALDLYDVADRLDPRNADAIATSATYGLVAQATR